MGISRLRALLEKKALEEDIQFIIPHPLLPPRFREICGDCNMILLLDRDLTIHVRWEGERLSEHHPLTKGATRRLIGEVLRKAKEYRRELEVFGRFVDELAEEPFDDDRYEIIRLPKDPPRAEREASNDTEDSVIEIPAVIPLGPSRRSLCVGGSTPLPEWDW